MKPGDHPQFFQLPPPEGRSRESTIRLDANGAFTHDGEPVTHPGLAQAMHTWIRRHPDDGRYILSNGYDWSYFTVDDAPFTVKGIREEAGKLVLHLSDGTSEPWDIASSRVGEGDALYTTVKRHGDEKGFEARFTRFAQGSLSPYLGESGGRVVIRVGSHEEPLPAELGRRPAS
jgi:uncharacterized protein